MKFSGYLETTFRRGGVEVRHVAFSLYLCFFPVSAIYFCTGIVLMCMFFVLLSFTHPLLVGTLSRVIKRQTTMAQEGHSPVLVFDSSVVVLHSPVMVLHSLVLIFTQSSFNFYTVQFYFFYTVQF